MLPSLSDSSIDTAASNSARSRVSLPNCLNANLGKVQSLDLGLRVQGLGLRFGVWELVILA